VSLVEPLPVAPKSRTFNVTLDLPRLLAAVLLVAAGAFAVVLQPSKEDATGAASKPWPAIFRKRRRVLSFAISSDLIGI